MISSWTDRSIFIFSSARSGSTWLAKIFDSHPDVLYLHEPDIADRGLDLLPYWFEAAPDASQTESARIYLDRLLNARTPRATGTRPFFPKGYRNRLSETARRGLIYLAKAGERAGFGRVTDQIRVPDLSDRQAHPIFVVKSVTALGRIEAFLKGARGRIQPVLLVRHPCGYIRSMLHGEELGVMNRLPPFGKLLDTRSARALNARQEVNDTTDNLSHLAWDWLITNSEAEAAVREFGGITITYESLAQNPLTESQQLFASVGLGWSVETERFLQRTDDAEGSYYSVFRNANTSANLWRTEFDQTSIGRVRAIVTRHPLGKLFFPD